LIFIHRFGGVVQQAHRIGKMAEETAKLKVSIHFLPPNVFHIQLILVI